MKRPAAAGTWSIQRWREEMPPAGDTQHLHRRLSRRDGRRIRACCSSCARRRSTTPAALPTATWAPQANDLPGMLPMELHEERRARFMAVAEVSTARRSAAWARPCRCWWTSPWALGQEGRRRPATGPTRPRSMAWLPPPEKVSKTYKVGDFVQSAHRGHAGARPGGRAGLERPRHEAKGR